MRRFEEETLVLATHNDGKVQEIGKWLASHVKAFRTAAELGLSDPEETEDSFVGNAVLKAKAAVQESGLPALADDSGLAVKALNGDPGIYSARWAETAQGDRDFKAAMKLVQDRLGDSVDRSAAFICVLALAWPDGHVETFEGRVEGKMVWPPRGDQGFGYDPMFVPDGDTRTFGEMDPAEKKAISHRAHAFEKLVKNCFV